VRTNRLCAFVTLHHPALFFMVRDDDERRIASAIESWALYVHPKDVYAAVDFWKEVRRCEHTWPTLPSTLSCASRLLPELSVLRVEVGFVLASVVECGLSFRTIVTTYGCPLDVHRKVSFFSVLRVFGNSLCGPTVYVQARGTSSARNFVVLTFV
jgi:hypothetical protein